MTADLRPEDFAAFFADVHGTAPFVWQTRLASQVFETGWPDVIDVPTGSGKTAVIDIAVFHLALEAHRGAARRAATRILFVVDRRLIVDAAHERAVAIATRLEAGGTDVLARVAARLEVLAEDGGPPLVVAKLRGGAPKDPDWVRTPAQPAVVVSTIDQVGSRLLFRGYGVSDSMKPVHAGLVGADALILLDEAHLSAPFVQTVRDSRVHQDTPPWSGNAAPTPFGLVTLSATPDASGSEPGHERKVFRLTDDDRAEPPIARRLAAEKPAALISKPQPELVSNLAEQTWALSRASGEGEAGVVAVVVNRVALARDVFEALRKRGALPLRTSGETPESDAEEAAPADTPAADLVLLIGRSREPERQAITRVLLERTRAGRQRLASDRPLFVVATQTIEVGADLDVDALVTEIAPLDALRQRFGRLDRLGLYGRARAAIVGATSQVAKAARPDPIYGTALKATWAVLEAALAAPAAGAGTKGKGKRGTAVDPTLDFGIASSDAWLPTGETLGACLSPRADAPVLLPRDIALWTRTSPVPAVDPDVSLYLHGPAAGPGDVSIVWRADLDDDLPEDVWIDRVAVCPPSALEAVTVPIGEARRWLAREQVRGDIADLEVGADEDDTESRRLRHALRWRGADDEQTTFLRSAAEVRPGDTIVVASTEGGCDRWGWAPRSSAFVPDLGRTANREHRGRDILRLTRASPELGLADPEQEAAARAAWADLSDREIAAAFETHLRTAHERAEGRPAKGVRVLRRDGRLLALERSVDRRDAGDAVSEDDDSGRSSRPVGLAEHCGGVARLAEHFARQAGLADELVGDLALAGLLHDAGKAHPAFQRWLHGGSELAALAGPPLAKSGRLPQGRAARQAAGRRAGLPLGARHEIASLAVAEQHPAFAAAHDPDLVLWLIGTHHGRGRPFFPTVDWPGAASDQIIVDLDDRLVVDPSRSLADLTAVWVELFERVQRRYGPWGLARLEAVLRLADHRRSAAERDAQDDAADATREAAE